MRPMEQARRPVTALAGRYGHPLHPALVAVPLGAWIASLVFDIASHLVHSPGFLTQGSRWLIGLGVVGAVLAALFGFLDLFAIPTGTTVFRIGLVHMTINLAVTVAYAIGFVIRGGPAGGPVGWQRAESPAAIESPHTGDRLAFVARSSDSRSSSAFGVVRS